MNDLEGKEKYLKAKEIASILRMDRTAVYKLPLPWIKIGLRKIWLVEKEDFEKFIRDRKKESSDELPSKN
ncbi:MAG: helix-turn-helix domain-containing protein [Candidatus Riflebacteria bacterium]|nr:helix-turn-helix domain-containing protein [Candidatus Riflebacteria bacterium]